MALLLDSNSRFGGVPEVEIQRSRFGRNSQHKTTFNTGDLIPIFIDEVLPGDTFSMDFSVAMRMTTPIYPVMDNANLDVYFFYVPNRLVWEHWKEFMGENNETAWEQPTEYSIPQITAPSKTGWNSYSLADYFGIPVGVSSFSVSALPFRAYCLIYNEWFRDQNVIDPLMINLDDATQVGVNVSSEPSPVTDTQLGAYPVKVAKYHDYFTSCLPSPQKGPAVLMPLLGDAPVVPRDLKWALPIGDAPDPVYMLSGTGQWSTENQLLGVSAGSPSASGNASKLQRFTGIGTNTSLGLSVPANLWADLSQAQSATVNQLRQAFAVQRLLEKDARGGSRYIESLKVHFGVTAPDASLQRPEYLGGQRIPVSMDQVLQTSATDTTSPQGNTAAYSLTNYAGSVFTKSFVEHGYVIGLACVRTEHTYQQGLERFWSRKGRFDFYWPALANIGEQAVLNKEIYLQGSVADDEAFGYQEAWAEYRYKPSRVSGDFRSAAPNSLDVWHYADDYSALPTLSPDWINETSVNVDRTLAVQSDTSGAARQFLADFYFKLDCVRPMPLYSVPGLIDHY